LCSPAIFFALWHDVIRRFADMKFDCRSSLLAVVLCTAPHSLCGQVPAWAQPGSATYVQVAPPADFHRPTRNFDTPIGIFEGQSDIGSALVPGGATYDGGADKSDTAVLSDVVLENSAGKVR
jgi:hypothetical protein